MGTIGIALFNQIVVMFLLMAAGFVLFKAKLITADGSKTLSNILLYGCTPCIIINSYNVEKTPERASLILISIGLAALALFIAIVIAALVYGRRNVIDNFGSAFSNAGFIGIPLVQAALGDQAVFYVSAMVALLNVLQWTYGVAVMTGKKDSIKPKKLLTNPILISFVIGLVIFATGVKLPAVVTKSVSYVAGMNAPIAMIIMGIYLAQTKVSSVFTMPRLYVVTAVRLVLIPLATLAAFCLIPAQYNEVKMTVLIAASAPIGANVAVYAQQNGKDYTYAVKEVCLSTILCIAVTPFVISLAEMIWK